MSGGFEVRQVRYLVPAEVRRLYEGAGWWSPGDDERGVPALLRGSACVAAAFADGTLVGFGRVLSDGTSDAWIQDVTVLPAYRGRGIGKAIVEFLRDWCRARGMGWIGLVAEPGTTPFYRRLGFRPLDGYVPMRLEPEEP